MAEQRAPSLIRMFDDAGQPRFPVLDVTVTMGGKAEILIDGQPLGWTSGIVIESQVNELTQVTLRIPVERAHVHGPAAILAVIESMAVLELDPTDEKKAQGADCTRCGADGGVEDKFCRQCGGRRAQP
jgi:hypothetical protein